MTRSFWTTILGLLCAGPAVCVLASHRPSPASHRNAPPVISISTSVFITSDTVQVKEGGRVIKFLGNVKATQVLDRLLCDELTSDKPKHLLHAKGHVSLYRNGDSKVVWEAFGDEGTYDTASGSTTLWNTGGLARLIRHPKDQPEAITLELKGKRIETDANLSFAHAQGNAYGWDTSTSTSQSIRFWAQEATYDGNRSLIDLEGGKPILVLEQPTETRKVTGRAIRYLIDEEKLIAEGEAVSEISPLKRRTP